MGLTRWGMQGTMAYIAQTEGMLPLVCQGVTSHSAKGPDPKLGAPSEAVRSAQRVASLDALHAYLLIW